MDTTELQAKLPDLTHLLPSQREWLDRLLFQLAFNDCQRAYIVGGVGSGKSTLALALAELFSEQYNVALLGSRVDESQVTSQLMQQWFNESEQSDQPLLQQVKTKRSALPLLLIVDDAARYSAALLQQLNALDCQQFYFCQHSPDNNADLVITLNRITSADAEQLLQSQRLNSIELSQRVALANGNMHLLLQPDVSSGAATSTAVPAVKLPVNPFFYVIAAVVFGILAFVFWPASDKTANTAKKPVVSQQQRADNSPLSNLAADEHATESHVVTEGETGADVLTVPETKAAQSVDVAENASDEHTTNSDIAPTEQAADMPSASDVIVKAPSEATTVAEDIDIAETAASESTAAETADTLTSFQYQEAQLLNLPKQQVAIQLAVLSSDAALQRFKRAYPQLATLSYQRNWQGKMQLVVLLAPFADAAAAKEQMKVLPEALRATGPFVKALQAAQAEIRARQYSQQTDNTEF